jgi:protoheme ferro-lyase
MNRKPDESFNHCDRPIGLGVLLTNLGSPRVCSVAGLRAYYAEFLADRRVIEVPRAIWNLILYGFILPFRPYRILPQYEAVWNREQDKSPLLVVSEAQRDKLQQLAQCALWRRWSPRRSRHAIRRAEPRRRARRALATVSASSCCRSIRNLLRSNLRLVL